MASKLDLVLFMISFCILVPSLRASIANDSNVGQFDAVWKERELKAEKAALKAYQPNPEKVTDDFNESVQEVDDLDFEDDDQVSNITGRHLLGKKYKGPCKATNPIDRCWRCRKDWANDRKKLANCVKGFGRRTRGGKRGGFYVVTDPSDSSVVDPKPGTLRHAVIQPQPLWIIFARSMTIRLTQELIMTSHKTIDARGANVRIAHGAGITLQFVQNVIIHGLHIHDIVPGSGGTIRDSVDHFGTRTQSDGDGISIFGSSHIWLDHLSMWNCGDGLIDVIQGSTAITISNCHFTRHNDVLLFGASDSFAGDAIMQITVAFNHFGKGLVQRMPRCRWGFIHVVNNDYTHWLMYAIGGSSHPTIISQGNRFIAPPNHAAKEVTKRDYAPVDVWKNWQWRSEGDLMLNGAFFVESGVAKKNHGFGKLDMMTAKPGTFVTRLTRFAGTLGCRVGQKC